MSVWLAVLLFAVGLAVVLYAGKWFAEGTAEAVVRRSASLIGSAHVSLQAGYLAVGVAGTYEQASGIALGAIVGAAMAVIVLPFGLTALVASRRPKRLPRRAFVMPMAAVLVFGMLCLDGVLSRIDGAVLLIAYTGTMGVLGAPTAASIDAVAGRMSIKGRRMGWARTFGLLTVLLAALLGGAELLVVASEALTESIGWSDTTFGMTLLALLVGIGTWGRVGMAALRGRSDFTFGRAVGSALVLFLFNAGVIALVRPIAVDGTVVQFYLPVCLAAVVFITLVRVRGTVSRWAGTVVVGLYVLFVVGGYVPWL